jgi:hypothetical protein
MSFMCSPGGGMGAFGWMLGLPLMLALWGLLVWGAAVVFRTLTAPHRDTPELVKDRA